METSFQAHTWEAWIGTDEAGKGDYFGPLVAAGVYVNAQVGEHLSDLGIRDSKKMTDKRVRELAQQIRVHHGYYTTAIEVTPLRYNTLYTSFRERGQNLNHLLAWLHARAVKNLVARVKCRHVLVDRFAKNEAVLGSHLPDIEVVQVPKAESDIAVAAASVIARDLFLRRLEALSEKYHIQLPKGASQVIEAGQRFVEMHGPEALRHVGKLHFRTTGDIVGRK